VVFAEGYSRNMYRRKPYKWMHDPDWVQRALIWLWCGLGFFAAGLLLGLGGIVLYLSHGDLRSFFFIGLGTFIALLVLWAMRDDWTLDEREAI
jgi:hypothetical protein